MGFTQKCKPGHGVFPPPPLSQGCLAPIKVIIPKGSLLDPSPGAAVVGGNVLTSQRVVDVIFRAFEACAASQVREGHSEQAGLGQAVRRAAEGDARALLLPGCSSADWHWEDRLCSASAVSRCRPHLQRHLWQETLARREVNLFPGLSLGCWFSMPR